LGQVGGVGEQHAAQSAKHRDSDEEGDQAGIASHADDVMSHGLSVTRKAGS